MSSSTQSTGPATARASASPAAVTASSPIASTTLASPSRRPASSSTIRTVLTRAPRQGAGGSPDRLAQGLVGGEPAGERQLEAGDHPAVAGRAGVDHLAPVRAGDGPADG